MSSSLYRSSLFTVSRLTVRPLIFNFIFQVWLLCFNEHMEVVSWKGKHGSETFQVLDYYNIASALMKDIWIWLDLSHDLGAVAVESRSTPSSLNSPGCSVPLPPSPSLLRDLILRALYAFFFVPGILKSHKPHVHLEGLTHHGAVLGLWM